MVCLYGEAARVMQVRLSAAAEARAKVGVLQSAFAKLIGVSLRTLQDWEQGRRQPTGAAQTLLRVASQHPEACTLPEIVYAQGASLRHRSIYHTLEIAKPLHLCRGFFCMVAPDERYVSARVGFSGIWSSLENSAYIN